MTIRVVILGAAGRDFHNFNVCYRSDPAVTVAAFTAAQIPNIAGRRYPAELAGSRPTAFRSCRKPSLRT
jgi:predicted GTPase